MSTFKQWHDSVQHSLLCRHTEMGVTCRQKLDCFLFPFVVRLESGKAADSTAHISARHSVPSLPGQDPALLLMNYIIREKLMMRNGDKSLPEMWQEFYGAR